MFIRKAGKGTGVAPEAMVTVLDKNELKIGTEGQLELKPGHGHRQVVIYPADDVQRATFRRYVLDRVAMRQLYGFS